MPKIEYLGHADKVVFHKADFERHDITDQGMVTFDLKDKKIREVSQAAFDYLSEKHVGGQDFGEPKEPASTDTIDDEVEDESDLTAPGAGLNEDEGETPPGTGGPENEGASTPAPATGAVKKGARKAT